VRRHHNIPPRARPWRDGDSHHSWAHSEAASLPGSRHQTAPPSSPAAPASGYAIFIRTAVRQDIGLLWHFATAEATARRLRAAGFVDAHAWLHDEPAPLEPGAPLETSLATVILGAHLDRLPAPARPAFVRAVAAGLPRPERPVIDCVRLNFVARRRPA
jgi:hypothetical protein